MSPCFKRTQRPSFRSMAGKMITSESLNLPFEKTLQKGKADALTLLGMELRADDVVASDDGRDRSAVIRRRQNMRRTFRPDAIGVHEIHVRPVRHALQHRMRAKNAERIPTHMRNLQTLTLLIGVRGNPDHLTRNPSQALVIAVLAPDVGEQLHADADAEERGAALQHLIFERRDHARNGG